MTTEGTQNTPAPQSAPAGQPAANVANEPKPGQTEGFGPFSNDEVPAAAGSAPQGLAAELMNKKDSWYWKEPKTAEEHLLHQQAVAVVAADVERRGALEAQAAGKPPENLPTSARLGNRNLSDYPVFAKTDPRALDSDRDLGNLMTFVDKQQIPTPVVREMFDAFADALVAAGRGNKISDAQLDAMESRFRGKLRGDQIRLLRRWLREEVRA